MSRLAEAQAYHAACMKRMESLPEPEGQKFPRGTRVRIANDLGSMMDHFPGKGCNATVMYTHTHAFNARNYPAGVKSYCLDIDDYGEVSWYEEHQLTEIQDE